MGSDSSCSFGYGFIVKGKAANRKLDDDAFLDHPDFDGIEVMYHNDFIDSPGSKPVVVIAESMVEAFGFNTKPTSFSLTKITKKFRANRADWDERLQAAADRLGVDFEVGHWYLACHYS